MSIFFIGFILGGITGWLLSGMVLLLWQIRDARRRPQ